MVAFGVGPPFKQPVAEFERGEAVLLVVGGYRLKPRGLAIVEPSLKFNHRLVAGTDHGPTGEEQLLNVLQRVRLDAGTQRLPDYLEQVDENLATQEVID